MTIARDAAAAVVESLEETLLHLLRAGALLDEADAEDPTWERMALLWLPTATTTDLLLIIEKTFPDLTGLDLPFRNSKHRGTVRRLSADDIIAIRADVAQALASLERVLAMLQRDSVRSEGWIARCVESTSVLTEMLQHLTVS